MPRILVTAFEPFGGDVENASATVLELELVLERAGPVGCEVVGEVLPVVFDGSAFEDAVRRHAPAAIVCLGEARMRRQATVERRAVNVIDVRIPDNAGEQPHDEPVEADGPAVREASLDVPAVCAAFAAAGVPAAPSDDAGRYVCNATAYRAYGLDRPAVFIHVPALRRRGTARVGGETDTAAFASESESTSESESACGSASGRSPRAITSLRAFPSPRPWRSSRYRSPNRRTPSSPRAWRRQWR